MKNKLIKYGFIFLFLGSCMDEPVETVFFDLDTKNGVFITCEGNFMYGNASLSFYNSRKKIVQNDLFYARNNAPLGDVAQSMNALENALFVVVNNSGKIYALDMESAGYKGLITGLTSPRYIHFLSEDKAYVSDLYANNIWIINPSTFKINGKIELTELHTSEQMVQVGKYVYVTSWSFDESLLIIDTETDSYIDSIRVQSQPKDLVVDKNDKIWILSEGSYVSEIIEENQGAITRIDPDTRTIQQVYKFENTTIRPSDLEINNTKDTVYFLCQDVFKMSIDARRLPESSFITADEKKFYKMAVNPFNNEIYVADAIDFMQDAVIYRFSQPGEPIDTFKAGVNPSDFLFRQTN